MLTSEIITLFEEIKEASEPENLLKEIVVLDYLITLKQLLELLKEGNMEEFHGKSKIQAIVEGDVIDSVSCEHVKMIGNKLRALSIIWLWLIYQF